MQMYGILISNNSFKTNNGKIKSFKVNLSLKSQENFNL